MSYILDALKKSELERNNPLPSAHAGTRRAPPTLSAAPAAATLKREPSSRGNGRWYWIFGGALLINGGITLYHHYSDPRHQIVATAAGEPSPAPAQAEKTRLIQPTEVVRQSPLDVNQTALSSSADASDHRDIAPLLKDKPANFRHGVPKMNVDLHVYAERPSERFALINMAKFREGDEIGRGFVLEQITPVGLIISLNGDRFRIDTRY